MHCHDVKSFVSRFIVLLAVCVGIPSAPHAQAAAPEKLTNSIGMEFVRISPATFSMASSPDVPPSNVAQSECTVTLSSPFYILTGKVSARLFEKSGLKGSPDHPSRNDPPHSPPRLPRPPPPPSPPPPPPPP